MALGTKAVDDTIAIADINDIKEHLEGNAGSTLAYFLRVLASNDFKVRLPEKAGAQKFIVEDSDGTTVFSVDSLGNVVWTGEKTAGKDITKRFSGGNTTVNNSTTHVNVTGSDITVDGTEDGYWFDYFITYNSNATADIEFGFQDLGGSEVIMAVSTHLNTSGTLVNSRMDAASPTIQMGGTGADETVRITGHVRIDIGTLDAGTFGLTMAQATANASDTTVNSIDSWFQYGTMA